MNDMTLLELANTWKRQATRPECEDGSDEARIPNAKRAGERAAKAECADQLRELVRILGDA